MRAGRKRGVTDDGLGVGVSMMGILENRPLVQEISKTALAESILISARQIAA